MPSPETAAACDRVEQMPFEDTYKAVHDIPDVKDRYEFAFRLSKLMANIISITLQMGWKFVNGSEGDLCSELTSGLDYFWIELLDNSLPITSEYLKRLEDEVVVSMPDMYELDEVEKKIKTLKEGTIVD